MSPRAVARVAVEAPANGVVETGGPEKFHLDEIVKRRMAEVGDAREADHRSRTAPTPAHRIDDTTLVPGKGARLGETTLAAWLTTPVALAQNKSAQSAAAKAAKN